MSEMTENSDNPPVNETEGPANNSAGEPKMSTVLSQNSDKSGDWNKSADAWYTNSRNVAEEIASFELENGIEWKYRNLFSMSTPTSQPVNRSPCRAVATMSAELLQCKCDESTNESKSYLDIVREHLANYQESYGTPRGEYSFASLIKVMGQATGRSLLALFYIFVIITPMAQIFLYVLRFVLDKMISIRNTSDCRQAIVKNAILGLQLLCIYVCLVFIFGFIGLPVLQMVVTILAKILMWH